MGDLNCKQSEEPYKLLDTIMDNVRLSGALKYKNNLDYGTFYTLGQEPHKEWGYIIDHTLNSTDNTPLLLDIEFKK